MSSPRFPGRDLRLERLDRDSLRPHLGEVAQTSAAEAREILAAYEALIDAVFLTPGAAEWLSALRAKVAAFIASKEPRESAAAPAAVARDAIRQGSPDPGRA